MNEELTNEDKVFQAWLNDAATSVKCVWTVLKPEFITRLARMYFEERAKPKVWDGAPEWVNAARVRFFVNDRNDGHSEVFSETYTCRTPKTRARQIAENPACPFKACPLWDDNADGKCGGELHGGSAQETCKWYADYESALNKYAEELEGKE